MVQVHVRCFCLASRSPHDQSTAAPVVWAALPACGHIAHSACYAHWAESCRQQKYPFTCPTCRDATTVYVKPDKSKRRPLERTALFFESEPHSSDPFPESQLSQLPQQTQQPWTAAAEDDDEVEDPPDDSELRRVRAELERERREKAEMRNTLRELRERTAAELALVEARLGDRDASIEALQAEVEDLRAGQPDLVDEIKGLKNALRERDENIELLATSVLEQQEDHRAEREAWAAERMTLTTQKEKMLRRINKEGHSGARTIKELNTRIKELNATVKSHDERIKTLQNQHAEEIANSKAKIQALHDDVREKVDGKRIAQEERDRSRHEIDRLKHANASYHAKLAKLKEANADLNRRLVGRRGIGSSPEPDDEPPHRPVASTSRVGPFQLGSPSPTPPFRVTNRTVLPSPRRPLAPTDDYTSEAWDDDVIILDEADGTASSPGKKSMPLPLLLAGSSSSLGPARRRLASPHPRDRHLPDLTAGLVDTGPKKKIRV